MSVVLVNFRSAPDTLEAIDGIAALDWPPDRLQTVVVDNDSGDGSADTIRTSAPHVKLVEAERNLGFAAGCNLGVERSDGEYVAFLNNDARPEPGWIRAAVEAFDAQPGLGCVASKVLDWDGSAIDFAAAGMSFDGQGYKLHVGAPDQPAFDEPDDVLFATGAAMVVPRWLFEKLGGFDERYFMFFEDVDFGWRTWLSGYRVRYVPTSVVRHRHHATMSRYGSWYEAYLLNRNALFTIYKNYEADTLERVLPAALLLTLRRGIALGGADAHSLDLERADVVDGDDQATVSKQLLAATYAVDSFTESLPQLEEARQKVQDGRMRSDRELVRLFRKPFQANIAEQSYVEAFESLSEIFEVAESFGERRRIVVATSDTLTPRMAGPAIRSWHMAKLLSREHEVRLVTRARCEVSHPDFDARGGVGLDEWRELEQWCDVIVLQGFLLHDVPFLAQSRKVIVVDLYDPFHLEQLELFRFEPLEWRTNVIADSVRVLNEQILRGDYFMCASEKQRDFWLGQLAAMQRVNPLVYERDESLSKFLSVVPFGVADEPPVRTGPGIRGVVDGIGPDDKVIIWGGGIYNWFDPLTLIRAVDRLRHRIPEVRLYFMGTKHPNPDVAEMRVSWEARQLAEELGLMGSHVFFNDGWVPYDERQNHLLDADIGVTNHFDHIETEFSFRTRVLDYFWTSLPVVSTAGDTLADLIEQRRLGLTVEAEDVEGLEAALHTLLTDDELAAECRRNVTEIAAELRWSQVMKPLVEFCRRAERAPDALQAQPVVKQPHAAIVSRELVARVKGKLRAARNHWLEGGPAQMISSGLRWLARRLGI